MELYLGLCILMGLISKGNGWSFSSAFIVSIFTTPVVGAIFVWIRGEKIELKRR